MLSHLEVSSSRRKRRLRFANAKRRQLTSNEKSAACCHVVLTKCGELSGKCKVDALGQFVELILSSSSDDLARISHLLGSGALSEQHQAECHCDGSSSSSVANLRFKRLCAARLQLCTAERPAVW